MTEQIGRTRWDCRMFASEMTSIMVDYLSLIQKYYDPQSESYAILIKHSSDVAQMAGEIVQNHPQLHADARFVFEASMLHDIGICHVSAPFIGCHGTLPYICHGYRGAEMLRSEGLERHALVAERHTGTGITVTEMIRRDLPTPRREMVPVSIEEQIICFSDLFFSKTHLGERHTVEEVREKITPFGKEGIDRFNDWCRLFI